MSLSKRIRFEVFKRDAFTCQYCGKKAPDVVLHVDHVVPRAKGGSDDILNLVTACGTCNAGKSDVPLSDDSAIVKQRTQLESLQERQEQIAMMIEWQRSLASLDQETGERLANFWCDLSTWFDVTPDGKNDLRKLLRKFSVEEVMEAMRIAAGQYFKYDDDGNPTNESAELAFSKIGGICTIRRAEKSKPWLSDLFYVRGILRNRHASGDLQYLNYPRMAELLDEAFQAGADPDEMKKIARNARSWTAWQNLVVAYIEELGGA